MTDRLWLYHTEVKWSDEDQGYIAAVPDLPGCCAFGNTMEKAVAELQYAIVAWTEAAKKSGRPIPSPTVWGRDS